MSNGIIISFNDIMIIIMTIIATITLNKNLTVIDASTQRIVKDNILLWKSKRISTQKSHATHQIRVNLMARLAVP